VADAKAGYGGWAALVVLVAAALWCGPSILRADLFDGDAAHHIFWLYRFAESGLFPADITVDYLRTSAPLGYRALYFALAPWLDAMFASKLVSLILFIVSGWLAYLLGYSAGRERPEVCGALTAIGLVVMLSLSTQTEILATMGMQRAFGLPLTLLCAWALVARRYVFVGWSWVAAALTYPVVLPVLGLAAGGVFLRDWYVTRKLPPSWLANGVLGVVALGLALLGVPKAPELGPVNSYVDAVGMPEFGPGGRLDLYGERDLSAVFWHGMTGLGWAPRVFVLLAVGIVVLFLLRRSRDLPWPIWMLLAVGLGLWAALRLWPEQLMFGLYLPNRHPRWAIAVFGSVLFAVVTMGLWDVAAARTSRRGYAPLVAILGIGATAMLVPQAGAQWKQPVDHDLQNVYRWLGEQPADLLIAAHPDVANYVPLYARRSVLASTETSMPWMRGYYLRVKPRLEASLEAAYATDLETADRILAPFGVGAFVTGPEVWRFEGYLEPYDRHVRDLIALGRRNGFAFQEPPADRILFRSGPYFVVRVGAVP
jgi:hypothetical protein